MLSCVDVKMIGSEAVPLALRVAPLATIKAEAKEPVPEEPLMIVPGLIVKVAPAGTTTFWFNY